MLDSSCKMYGSWVECSPLHPSEMTFNVLWFFDQRIRGGQHTMEVEMNHLEFVFGWCCAQKVSQTGYNICATAGPVVKSILHARDIKLHFAQVRHSGKVHTQFRVSVGADVSAFDHYLRRETVVWEGCRCNEKCLRTFHEKIQGGEVQIWTCQYMLDVHHINVHVPIEP